MPGVAEEPKSLAEPPAYSLLRAEENYNYLRNRSASPYTEDYFDPLKHIRLGKNSEAYVSFGGEFRPRYAYFENRLWENERDVDFYSQRISAHANWHLKDSVRLFTELYHGYTSHEKEIAEYDELDWHQAFFEYKTTSGEGRRLSLRFGRQEMGFGAARVVGLREGPNIRRSFDAVRTIYSVDKNWVQAFFGREVFPRSYVFDNDFEFFDDEAANPYLWGMYSQFSIKGDVGPTELYYLGFKSDLARFNDVSGKEKRHSIGVRRFGRIGKSWVYNSELIYQFGDIGGADISAFNIETDWRFEFVDTAWRPGLGIKLEYTTGDDETGDGEINSFNPMFVNPEYYSLAKTVTPVNMISVHPSIVLYPREGLTVYLEWAAFWRESKNDGLYAPPRFLRRDGAGINSRKIGNQIGIRLKYAFNRHVTFDLDVSYFSAEAFLEDSGESDNILHIAPTISCKF